VYQVNQQIWNQIGQKPNIRQTLDVINAVFSLSLKTNFYRLLILILSFLITSCTSNPVIRFVENRDVEGAAKFLS